MAYTNFTNCTQQEYIDVIYSQDDKNRIRIKFNGAELDDAGQYCISLEGTNRVLPDDGSSRFSIGNFIARDYTLVLRDLPVGTTIADQVEILIGTVVDFEYVETTDEEYLIGKKYYSYSNDTYTLLVEGTDYDYGDGITNTVYETSDIYEDVPIGIFNIQDTPETDQNQIAIHLRDNRVKFDFGYDASEIIETEGGSATLGQILNDICTKAGVTNDVTTFNGESIAVSIYDNTIKGSAYVAYIAEQAGAIPVITREGHLDFVYLNNLKTWRIPLSIVEKYEIGKPFEVERVVYESGIIKYETSQDETLETLYLDAANPYISSQAQVDDIFDIMEDFTIDSATTGRILGNPAIDAYDLIEIYDDDTDNTILKTLANNTYTFNGVHRNTFDTTIGEEERKENVTISSEATNRRWAKTEIDNLNASIKLVAGDIEDVNELLEGYYILTTDTTFQNDKSYYILQNNEYILVEQYSLTSDETYQSGKDYYSLNNDVYTLLVAGVDYNIGDTITGSVYEQNYAIGDTIPSNTYYELMQDNSLEKRMSQAESTLTSQGLTLDIVSTNIDTETGDILSLKRMNYEMGGNGFIIDDGSGFKSVDNTTGKYYYDNNTMIGKYTKDGSVQKDMALFGKYYYGIEESVNVETFTKDDAMFVAELYTDSSSETGFGHFYNGS